jgi:hypothetical protein
MYDVFYNAACTYDTVIANIGSFQDNSIGCYPAILPDFYAARINRRTGAITFCKSMIIIKDLHARSENTMITYIHGAMNTNHTISVHVDALPYGQPPSPVNLQIAACLKLAIPFYMKMSLFIQMQCTRWTYPLYPMNTSPTSES